jgi:hypothetical protein
MEFNKLFRPSSALHLGEQDLSGRYRQDENLLPLSEIEPKFLSSQ